MIQMISNYFFSVEAPSESREVSKYEIKNVGHFANGQIYAPSMTTSGIPFVTYDDLWLYDLQMNETSHLKKLSIPVCECQSNGRYVACGFLPTTEVLLYDLEDKTTKKLTIEGFGYPEMVKVLVLNEKWMAAVMGFDKAYFLSAYNLKTDLAYYMDIPMTVNFADGNRVFIGPDTLALNVYDKTIVIDLSCMKIVQTLEMPEIVTLAASGEEKEPLITVNPSGEVNFWDIENGCEEGRCVLPHVGEFLTVEVLDSKRLAYFISSPTLGSVFGILDRQSNETLFEEKLSDKGLDGVVSFATLALKETQRFVVSPQQKGADMIVYHFDPRV